MSPRAGDGHSRWTVGDPATPLPLRVVANLYVGIFGGGGSTVGTSGC